MKSRRKSAFSFVVQKRAWRDANRQTRHHALGFDPRIGVSRRARIFTDCSSRFVPFISRETLFMTSNKSREVLIAGGGIGGVATALALARRGIRSRVMERAPEFGEIGYGIQLGPNAYRMLDFLGVVREIEETAVHPEFLVLIDALTDKELTRISCGAAFKARYGAPYMVVHRRDLHGALLKACQAGKCAESLFLA